MISPSSIKLLRIVALFLAMAALLTACTPADDARAGYVPAMLELPQDVTRTISKTGAFVSLPASAQSTDAQTYEQLLDADAPLVSEVTSSKSTSSKSTSSKTLSDSQLKKLSHTELLAINPDYFGKLTVEGPGIHEIVCVGDKYDDYLRKSFYKKYYYYGTIFVEPGTSQSFVERNIVLYGHNTGKSKPNNNKFGKLRYFREDGYAVKNPYIYIDTPLGKLKYEVFTVFLSPDFLPAAEWETHFNRRNFSSAADAKKFMEAMEARSMYDCNTGAFTGNENLVTLVTCMYDFEGAKLIVMGRQVS